MMNKEAFLIRKFYQSDGKVIAKLDNLFEKAVNGGAKEKFKFASEMMHRNSAMFAPSHVYVYKQALEIFEEAGNEGCIEAMEMAASFYAQGIAHSTIEETYNRSIPMISMIEKPQPDFYKAKEWALKAAAAGSEWATKALQQLEKDIAKLEGRLPPEEKPQNPSLG